MNDTFLYEIYFFVNEITASSSRNYKLDVLKSYKDSSAIKTLLHFLYNPYITTGISDKKLNKRVTSILAQPMRHIFELCDYLKENNHGNDDNIATIQAFICNCDPKYKDLIGKIVTKNIQLGVDSLSINKVIPNLIPTFSVQLANKYFERPSEVEGKCFTLTTKIDGGRIIAIKKNNEVKFYTRAGQRYEGLVDLEAEMLSLFPDNIALDGEITLLDPGNLSSKEQYKETMKITRKNGEKHDVRMKVFDMMSADEFMSQCCNILYKDRRNNLDNLFSHISPMFFVKLDILYQGSDSSVIPKILNAAINKGEEGIMININDAKYEFSRTWSLMKCKKMQDIDLEIVGYEEGTNSNKGKLGAFIVNYRGYDLKVGSGYTKAFREEAWKHIEDYVGMTLSVQYFEETENQNGGLSLRFPVALDIREDKNGEY